MLALRDGSGAVGSDSRDGASLAGGVGVAGEQWGSRWFGRFRGPFPARSRAGGVVRDDLVGPASEGLGEASQLGFLLRERCTRSKVLALDKRGKTRDSCSHEFGSD